MIGLVDAAGLRRANREKTVEITGFDVVTKWVHVEVSINARTAEYLLEQTPYIINRYGRDVYSFALRPCIHIDAFKAGTSTANTREELTANIRRFAFYPEVFEQQRGTKMANFQIQMESWHWESVAQFAHFLGCSTRAVIRCALSNRAYGLRQKERREAK